jgi:serine/threonine-protein kinase
VVLLVAVYFFTRSTMGTLVVTVSGPGGKAIDAVEVFVDGQKRCDGSPCRVDNLSEGPHLLRAAAKGYEATADQAVSVELRRPNTQNLTLVPATATGIRVTAVGTGLRLYVDGTQVGELPQTVSDLAPGDHVIKIDGSPRYEAWEQKVTVQPETLHSIGPLRLKIVKGLATFKAGPGAEGAKVTLDGRLIPQLPATIEVPGGKSLTLLATKEGYETFRRSIRFDEGDAEQTFEITMAEGSSARHGIATGTGTGTGTKGGGGGTTSSASAKGKAILNMNSIPVSNVILNGHPLGPTPKIGLKVDPGPQTVVFVHPSYGRKVQSANVPAGATKTFTEHFP